MSDDLEVPAQESFMAEVRKFASDAAKAIFAMPQMQRTKSRAEGFIHSACLKSYKLGRMEGRTEKDEKRDS